MAGDLKRAAGDLPEDKVRALRAYRGGSLSWRGLGFRVAVRAPIRVPLYIRLGALS